MWRGSKGVCVGAGPGTFAQGKRALYSGHKAEHGLARNETAMTRRGYEGWFVHSCTRTIEMRYRVDGRLIGVGILDMGEQDTSSVYYFFDPDESRRSLGVFSVMVEIAWLRAQGGRFHYLGLYVEDCRHLLYKAAYRPHERRVGAGWTRIDGPDDPASGA